MSPKHLAKDGRRGGSIITATTVAFALCGFGLIGVAIASQRSAPPLRPEVSTMDIAVSPSVRRPSDGPTVTGAVFDRSKPVALDIPTIDVHSVLNSLGQAADGSLETPAPGPHYDEAAWYRYSPTPGSLGPAVLLGHVDSAANGPSVFFRLGELRPGDEVSVTRADHSIAIFTVDEVHSYPKDDFPTKLVYGDIDHAGLRIVTCGGAFDDAAGHYLDNVVVFASLKGSRPL